MRLKQIQELHHEHTSPLVTPDINMQTIIPERDIRISMLWGIHLPELKVFTSVLAISNS